MLTMDKLVSGDKQRTTNTYGLKKVVLLNIKIFGFLFFLEANFVVFFVFKGVTSIWVSDSVGFYFFGSSSRPTFFDFLFHQLSLLGRALM